MNIFLPNVNNNKSNSKPSSLQDVIVKVTSMVSWDSNAQKLAKAAGLNINYVSWEDCARNKGSCWGPCISDMTLRVNESCMPVIRQPNFSDKTWDVKMDQIPMVVGNHQSYDSTRELQTISLSDYLSNFGDFITNKQLKQSEVSLLSQKENKDSHVIMSSQACFLPIQSGEETKFNVALFNYQSQPKNPAVLVIVSTSKGSSAQIIEGKEQHLLFNNFGKKADFLAERVSDVRKKKGQKNIHEKELSKEEKMDNVIVVVQVPLKQKKIKRKAWGGGGFGGGGMPMPMNECADQMSMFSAKKMKKRRCSSKSAKPDVEAAIVKVSERTKPMCSCGKELQKFQVQYAYKNGCSVECDGCKKSIKGKEEMVYHCVDAKNWQHKSGYDLCLECGDKQLQFDEFRGLLKDKKDWKLERNEDYPIRCTLQYYKATSNGEVNKEIMDDIVAQLETSQKQADFMGSLVTEYNPNRPSEWVNNEEVKEDADEYKKIRAFLKENGGKQWMEFVKNFEEQEVKDSDLKDLKNLNDAEWKELIPKIGPRNRFKKWAENQKNSINPVEKWIGILK